MYRQSSNRLIVVAAITIALLAMTLPLGFACEREGEEAPKADFTAEPTSGTAPLQVQFTDRSSGEIADWAWDFDNDGVPDSTERSPSYSYETPGRYTVSLVVTGPGGSDREIKAQYIEVAGAGPAPEAGFSAEPTSGPVSLEVQFTDESTGDVTSWSWDFGDDGTSTEQNPTHTYQNVGTYTVSLTVANPTGSDTETRESYITVYGAPQADFSASSLSVAATQEVEFADESTGATAWEWDFDDDGEVDSTEQNPFYAYDAPGEYTVTLTVTGPGGTHTETKAYYIEVTGRVTITIGELTDLTGPASPAVITLHYALDDIVNYYNQEGLIPGVKFDVVSWDNKYDPSRDVPGYEWVKEKGAELIISVIPQTGAILKPFADRDEFPIVSLSTHSDMLEPPGWVFSMSNPLYSQMKTLLKWISEEHWDYEVEARLPKVGLVGWSEPSILEIMTAMEEFSQDHPDQFEYVGGYMAPFGTMTWAGEVEKLKDCDYICAFGFPMGAFMRDFQARGYSTTFIDVGSASAYRGFLVDQCGYEALDGTLSANTSLWWDEGTPMVDLAEELLYRYNPYQADEIIYAGSAYVGGIHQLVAAFQILEQAAEEVGAGHFDGQAFYDAAVEYETTSPIWEGYPQWGFSETKRYLVDHVVIYEFDAAAQDLVRVSDWLPLIDGVPPEGYTLTIAVSPSGGGTTSPAVGTHTYDEGDVVTITATAASGYVFDKWSGASTATTATTTVTMTSNKTVTANFAPITAPPVPSLGTLWVYDVHYEDAQLGDPGYEDGVCTVAVNGEGTVDSEWCYVTTTAYLGAPVRYFEGIIPNVPFALAGATNWLSQTTLDTVKSEEPLLFLGAHPVTTYTDRTYTGDHAWELYVGKAWSYDEYVEEFVPLLEALSTKTYEAEVVAQEDVTVPAGTFDCYKIEYTLVAVDGTAVDPFLDRTEWWSAEVCGVVKSVSNAYAGVETQQLASYTPGEFTHRLDVSIEPEASGSLTLDPPGGTYAWDTEVTLTAVCGLGYAFDHWSGDLSGTTNPTTIIMDADKTVTANFSEVNYTLTMAVVGDGAADPAVGDHTYLEGTVVNITATPETGWYFVNWTGDVAHPYCAATTVTVDSDKTITANFSEMGAATIWVYHVTYGDETTEWTVTVRGEETVGGEDCYVTTTAFDVGAARYLNGTPFTLTGAVTWRNKDTLAQAKAEEYVDLFNMAITTYLTTTSTTGDPGVPLSVGKTWSYDEYVELDPPFAAPFTNTYEVEVVAMEDVTVPAGTFNCYKIEYTLIAVDGVAVVPVLEKTEWWSAEVSGLVKVINYTGWDEVEVQELTSCTLVPAANYTLTMAVTGNGTTDPAVGDHDYSEGTVVNIEATPETGWYFVNWTGDVADANDATTTVTMNADKVVTANFTNVTYTLTMAVDDPAHGSTTPAVGDHTYAEGSVVTITATAASGWAFDSWTGDVADPDSATTTVTMLSNVTVTANFLEYVGPPVPAVGSEWVYEVTYGASTETWTIAVTGEETVNGVDCYKTETAYDPAPDRTTGGTAVTITASVNYMSKATFDPVDWGGTPPSATVYSTIAAINLFGIDVTTYMTNTYTGGHGWDLSVNTAWTYEQLGTLVPPLIADFSKTYEVTVTGTQEVTVAAGTFTCYVIEHTVVAVDGAPVTPELSKIEYWCPDVSGLVKVIDCTQSTVGHLDWDEVETQELSSFTLV